MNEGEEILVKETIIEEAIRVHKNVPEFTEAKPVKEYFENRYRNHESLIIVAYYNGNPVGYVIGYEEIKGSKQNFYCWMAGVAHDYRRMGVLTQLMNYQIDWAKKKEYRNLIIKTRNNCREMLSFLVKKGFYFTKVEEQEKIQDNRIYLVKKLD